MYIYYVYAYLRLDGSPYYIGKGKGRRYLSKDHQIQPPTDLSRIMFLESGLTEIGALALERRYIRWYGRIDICTGILRNMTDGGQGASHRRPTFVFTCPRCDKQVELTDSKRNRSKKYCSVKCAAQRAHSMESKTKRSSALKITTTFTFTCEYCGNQKELLDLKRYRKKKYCDRNCLSLYRNKCRWSN